MLSLYQDNGITFSIRLVGVHPWVHPCRTSQLQRQSGIWHVIMEALPPSPSSRANRVHQCLNKPNVRRTEGMGQYKGGGSHWNTANAALSQRAFLFYNTLGSEAAKALLKDGLLFLMIGGDLFSVGLCMNVAVCAQVLAGWGALHALCDRSHKQREMERQWGSEQALKHLVIRIIATLRLLLVSASQLVTVLPYSHWIYLRNSSVCLWECYDAHWLLTSNPSANLSRSLARIPTNPTTPISHGLFTGKFHW